jgi:hypothetical protein
MVISEPVPYVHRLRRAWASGALFLVLGLVLAFAPVRSQLVDGWSTGPDGVTVRSTHTGYCTSGNLFHRVMGGAQPRAALDGVDLGKVLEDERCAHSGRLVRVLAALLILVGAVRGTRRSLRTTPR